LLSSLSRVLENKFPWKKSKRAPTYTIDFRVFKAGIDLFVLALSGVTSVGNLQALKKGEGEE